MKDPYEVLGVPRGSDREKVKAAYRELAKKYHPDQYAGTPLADLANEKMQEVNEAYDAILSGSSNTSTKTLSRKTRSTVLSGRKMISA